MDYILKTSLDENEELALTLTERKSRGYPAENFADIDYADDIALASKINIEKNRIYKYKPKNNHYGSTTWTQTAEMKKRIDGTYTECSALSQIHSVKIKLRTKNYMETSIKRLQ